MELIRVGVDIAKNVFQVHGVDANDQGVWQQRLPRNRWLEEIVKHVPPGCEIGMEACAGAHHWARRLEALGYVAMPMAGQFVKPYVKSNKNDARDAEAICEAMSRPNMRFVAVKTVEQQDIQAALRIRDELVKQRTAKCNQIRGLVAEYGLVTPRGRRHLYRCLPEWLEDAENGLSVRFRRLLCGVWQDLKALDVRIGELDAELEAIAKQHPVARRLQQLRGVGPLTATALLAAIGDGSQFANGRQMAAALGLTPKQHSSGDTQRLLGISKRGNTQLRTLLIHGARSVVQFAPGKQDRLSVWVTGIAKRRHKNVAAVALANKTARMAFAMLRSGDDYDPNHRHAAA